MASDSVAIGSLEQLQSEGYLLGKLGSVPVVVFWHDDRAWAIEDRCPHLGFPLHRGTVEDGLVTCHWHHARFDLDSGCTLDPFADDARGFAAEVSVGEVRVRPRGGGDDRAALRRRLRSGLEDANTLVIAKSVLGLTDTGDDASQIVSDGLDFGVANRQQGWGSGLTVLIALTNLLPYLDPVDRPRALVHGLRFVATDVAGRSPRFALTPLTDSGASVDRLGGWYRRFIETRSSDAAERSLATLIARGDLGVVHDVMFAAATDHVFIDEGHTIDFTNKAFEALEIVGESRGLAVLGTLVPQTARGSRSEERSAWRYPHDLAALASEASDRLAELWDGSQPVRGSYPPGDVAPLGHALLVDDPHQVIGSLLEAICNGATSEQLGRAVAYAAGLRIAQFHVQNDHADWNTVHHGFTTANALYVALVRRPSVELLRGLVHSSLRLYQDRFLNIPTARLPDTTEPLSAIDECFEAQGEVDRAGAIVMRHILGGGDSGLAIARLGRALLHEDAEFHWYQTVEAGIRQARAWPEGCKEQARLLGGVARFLAAHTPTRRELPKTIEIAARLRRGDSLYEDSWEKS